MDVLLQQSAVVLHQLSDGVLRIHVEANLALHGAQELVGDLLLQEHMAPCSKPHPQTLFPLKKILGDPTKYNVHVCMYIR